MDYPVRFHEREEMAPSVPVPWLLFPACIQCENAIRRSGLTPMPILAALDGDGEIPWEYREEIKHGIWSGKNLLVIAKHSRDVGVHPGDIKNPPIWKTDGVLRKAGFPNFAIAICDFVNRGERPEIFRATGLWSGRVDSPLVDLLTHPN